MAFFGFRKSKSTLAGFTGFKSVRPALGEAGQERFGVIEIASEYALDVFAPDPNSRKRQPESTVLTAALRLSGPSLNRFLAEGKDDQAFFARLCQALPSDSPAQFWLRRRRGQLESHYAFWQQQAHRRLGDPEIANYFAQDYRDSLIYPIEDTGLADLWCGLFVSGRHEEELAARLGWLVSNLPCEATPCSAAELSGLLLDYFAPGLLENEREQGQADSDRLYTDWLSEIPFDLDEAHFYNGNASAYWTLSAPPLKEEAGWTRDLLENEALAFSEFDITVHLAPAHQENTMREVLERRREMLAGQIEKAQADARRVEAHELREHQREIENRLSALNEGQQRYFEIGISLMLRGLPETLEEECAVFEDELESCGLAAHRTLTRLQTQCAMLDCAPLNLSRFDRPFVLPAIEAGRLAHIGVTGQPQMPVAQPLVGLSPAGEAVYLNPAPKPGQTAFFLLGETGKISAREADCVARYLAAMRSMRGGPICGIDRKGGWARLVQQLGGRYISFGPHEREFHFNPLEVTAESLNQISNLESWVGDLGKFLTGLLELNEEQSEDLSAVLLGAAIERANRGEELSATSLWIRAETGGFERLVEPLKQLCLGGRFGWLFARPTYLPLPGRDSLLFLGLSPETRTTWNDESQHYYFARLFARFTAQAGAHVPTQPYLLLIDDAHELLADPVATRSLAWLGQNGSKVGASLWLLSPRADEWLNSYSGRTLLEQAQTQLFFNQSGVGLTGLARRLNLSQRFLKTVREAVPGAALVRQIDQDGDVTLFSFEGLPSDYLHRLSGPARSLAAASSAPVEKAKPLEVPLFADEEIWDNDGLENLQGEQILPDWETIEPFPAIAYA